MAKQVPWTKVILETFIEESGIKDRVAMDDEKARIQEGILRTRFAGWTITKQAMEFELSRDTVNKYIKELKELYDTTQKNSMILPERLTNSKQEEEMDQ